MSENPYLDFYRNLPQIYSRDADNPFYMLWKIRAERYLELEQIMLALGDLLDEDLQSGLVLDQINGPRLHEQRLGRSDADYRTAIKLAILRMASGGSVPELVNMGKLLFGDGFVEVRRPRDEGSARTLDGSWRLDGTNLLDGLRAVNGHLTGEIVVNYFRYRTGFDEGFDEGFARALNRDRQKVIDAANQALARWDLAPAGMRIRVIKTNSPESIA